MDYREQCISQQLISANSSLQEFYYPCPNRYDWFFRTLPCRNNVLVIHRLFDCFFFSFLQNVTKASIKKVWGLGLFPGDAPFAQVAGALFSRSLRKSRAEHHFCSLTGKPPEDGVSASSLPSRTPISQAGRSLSSQRIYPSLPPQDTLPTVICSLPLFPFNTCADDLSENQCKVVVRKWLLCPGYLWCPESLLGSLMTTWWWRAEDRHTPPSQLAVVRAHLLTSML